MRALITSASPTDAGKLLPIVTGSESFDTVAAALYIGCSPGHLIKLRGEGTGPPFHRLFRRKGITYRRHDIDVWLAGRRFGSTSEYPEALA